MSHTSYEVAFKYVDHRDNVRAKTKSFTSEDARADWLDRNEDKVVEVLGFREVR